MTSIYKHQTKSAFVSDILQTVEESKNVTEGTVLYQLGLKTKRGCEAANTYFELAKALGNADASFRLGCYFEKNINERLEGNKSRNEQFDYDIECMKEYFDFAAKLGHKQSQEKLALYSDFSYWS